MEPITVVLYGYSSPSGYHAHWESNAPNAEFDLPRQPVDSNTWWGHRFLLSPGDYVYCSWNPYDYDDKQVLIQVPADPMQFKRFCNAVQRAHRGDVEDEWILAYAVRVWNYLVDDGDIEEVDAIIERPIGLEEAVQYHETVQAATGEQ